MTPEQEESLAKSIIYMLSCLRALEPRRPYLLLGPKRDELSDRGYKIHIEAIEKAFNIEGYGGTQFYKEDYK